MKDTWKPVLLRYAKKHGLDWHDTALGVGIGFSDGCDVFWVLPGEAHSTYMCTAKGPSDPKDIIATYENINQVRGEVTHVIRHCLAQNDLPLDRLPNGHWIYQVDRHRLEVMVGPSLTQRAKHYKTTRKVLTSLWEYFDPCPLPTTKQINGYLKLSLPPENEKPIVGEHEPVTNELTPAQAVKELIRRGALVDCKTPAKLKSLKSGKSLGKISLALHLLAKQLKDCKAHIGDTDQGAPLLCLIFPDGFASHSINLNPKTLPEGIKGLAPDKAAQWLKEAYLETGTKRSRVLNAIWAEAENRGWYLDALGLTQGTCEYAFLGSTHQEVKFYPGPRLSKAITSGAIEDAIPRIMPDSSQFAKKCTTRLQCIPETPSPLPPTKNLPPSEISIRSKDKLLVKITDKRVKAYDAYCQGILDKTDDNPAMNQYMIENAYDLKSDTWRTPEEWQALAEHALEHKNPFNPSEGEIALRILSEVAPKQAEEKIRAHLDEVNESIEDYEGDEFSCEFIPILWRHRHDYPKLAAKWLKDGDDEMDDAILYAEERAALDDPVALRYQAGYIRDSLYEDDNSFPAAEDAKYLTASQLEHFHEKLLKWAQEEHRCSPLDYAPLALAVEMGWHDVGTALEKNPWLASGLLRAGRRPHGHDEPGILHAHKLILTWSRLAPGPYLAQLLLTAKETDLVGIAIESVELAITERQEAEQIAGASAIRSPQQLVSMADNTPDILGLANLLSGEALQRISDNEGRNDSTKRHYTNLLSDMETAFAIAWTRCRPQL